MVTEKRLPVDKFFLLCGLNGGNGEIVSPVGRDRIDFRGKSELRLKHLLNSMLYLVGWQEIYGFFGLELLLVLLACSE